MSTKSKRKTVRRIHRQSLPPRLNEAASKVLATYKPSTAKQEAAFAELTRLLSKKERSR